MAVAVESTDEAYGTADVAVFHLARNRRWHLGTRRLSSWGVGSSGGGSSSTSALPTMWRYALTFERALVYAVWMKSHHRRKLCRPGPSVDAE